LKNTLETSGEDSETTLETGGEDLYLTSCYQSNNEIVKMMINDLENGKFTLETSGED
jgi:hypothetical protein